LFLLVPVLIVLAVSLIAFFLIRKIKRKRTNKEKEELE